MLFTCLLLEHVSIDSRFLFSISAFNLLFLGLFACCCFRKILSFSRGASFAISLSFWSNLSFRKTKRLKVSYPVFQTVLQVQISTCVRLGRTSKSLHVILAPPCVDFFQGLSVLFGKRYTLWLMFFSVFLFLCSYNKRLYRLIGTRKL